MSRTCLRVFHGIPNVLGILRNGQIAGKIPDGIQTIINRHDQEEAMIWLLDFAAAFLARSRLRDGGDDNVFFCCFCQ